jgi:phenylpropionate dioxygenase-like ring-hydroxylating dioxygenase large terminal subunit
MLSTADNELMTQVGAGTVMGELLRRYWIPAVLSSEVVKDGVPHRTRLLGEDLLVFRVTSGDVGVVIPNCPHRGASLYFGRNEEEGLRCAYHGWKFDIAGRCIDMPSEPPESNFGTKVELKHYAARERNGVVWIYMGPGQEDPPELPQLEWNLVPESQVYLSKRVAQNNFMQTIEGEIDSSHSGFLHSRFDDPFGGSSANLANRVALARGNDQQGMVYKMLDKHPRFQTLDTDYGVLIGARRNAEEDSYYWRITQFYLPFHTMIPPYGANPLLSGHAYIPMDDYHTLAVCYTYHPTEPLNERQLDYLRNGPQPGQQGLHPTVDAFLPQLARAEGAWWPKHNVDNDFGVDWDAQRTTRFSGLPGTWPQDSGMQETMGRIYDRTQEHLGVSDTAIIRTRRRLIHSAKHLHDLGIEPSSATDSDCYHTRSAAIVLPRSEEWVEGSGRFREATQGVNHAAV